MIYLGEYKAGASVFYAANFHNDTGTLEDPTSPEAQIRNSAGTWSALTAPAKQNTKTGHYGGTIDTTGFSVGQHVIRMAGTVATSKTVATEFCFIVVANIESDTYARLGAPAGASISTDIAAIDDFVDTEVAAILAAVDIEVAAIKTKTDYLPSATAGAAGGLLIAGSNAATTFATLTVMGATIFTGNVAYQAGITITQSTPNTYGVTIAGNGTGGGLYISGGSSTGTGVRIVGGSTSGRGLHISAVGGSDATLINVAAGTGRGLYIYTDSGNAFEVDSISGNDITGNIIGNLFGSVESVTGAVGSVTTGVTVTTNNDKSGYALSATGVQAIWEYTTRSLTAFSTALALSVWDVLESAIATANSIGLKLKSNLDATVSSRLSSAGYTAPDNAGVTAIKAKTDNLPADPASNTQVNTRLATSGYTAPDNTSISAIKTKTDTIVWPDITDIKDGQLGKWSINKTNNVRTMYRLDGSTVLKQFNLIDNAAVSERVPV